MARFPKLPGQPSSTIAAGGQLMGGIGHMGGRVPFDKSLEGFWKWHDKNEADKLPPPPSFNGTTIGQWLKNYMAPLGLPWISGYSGLAEELIKRQPRTVDIELPTRNNR